MKLINLAYLAVAGLTAFTGACADPSSSKSLVLDDATLHGTYVHSGRVLLNPALMTPDGPQRQTIECFSLGSLQFDGKGSVARDVEIFCPSTDGFLALGLPPAPVGQPTAEDLAISGSSLTTQGSYTVDENGWGTIEETGVFRLGPVSDVPAAGVLQFSVGRLGVRGVAREVHFLVRNISLQFPGAPGLVNADVGITFVASHR